MYLEASVHRCASTRCTTASLHQQLSRCQVTMLIACVWSGHYDRGFLEAQEACDWFNLRSGRQPRRKSEPLLDHSRDGQGFNGEPRQNLLATWHNRASLQGQLRHAWLREFWAGCSWSPCACWLRCRLSVAVTQHMHPPGGPYVDARCGTCRGQRPGTRVSQGPTHDTSAC